MQISIFNRLLSDADIARLGGLTLRTLPCWAGFPIRRMREKWQCAENLPSPCWVSPRGQSHFVTWRKGRGKAGCRSDCKVIYHCGSSPRLKMPRARAMYFRLPGVWGLGKGFWRSPVSTAMQISRAPLSLGRQSCCLLPCAPSLSPVFQKCPPNTSSSLTSCSSVPAEDDSRLRRCTPTHCDPGLTFLISHVTQSEAHPHFWDLISYSMYSSD